MGTPAQDYCLPEEMGVWPHWPCHCFSGWLWANPIISQPLTNEEALNITLGIFCEVRIIRYLPHNGTPGAGNAKPMQHLSLPSRCYLGPLNRLSHSDFPVYGKRGVAMATATLHGCRTDDASEIQSGFSKRYTFQHVM